MCIKPMSNRQSDLDNSRIYRIRLKSSMMSNNSDDEAEHFTKESHLQNILFACYYLVVFIVAFPGNTMALWVFISKSENKTFTVFLRNLAIADISYVLILPVRIIYHLNSKHWPFGETLCRLMGFLFYLNMYCSLYFMTCISLDRLLAIVFPVKSINVRKLKNAHIISCILWVALTVSLLPLLFSPQTVHMDNTTVCLQLYREQPSRRALGSLSVAFIIPLITTVFSHLLIMHRLCKRDQVTKSIKDKAIKMIILVMIDFFVCFVPYHVNRFVYIHAFSSSVSSEMKNTLSLSNRITSALTSLNGALNPILYFFLTQKFRKTLLNLLGRDEYRDSTTGYVPPSRGSKY
ncbi:uracil nucleotide/cysteinyl leukotriene receptor [Polyodon spathula]|uniref:uracil nucleotide/cysteinyl leukotriene receptor n=1 Tax=Polyodon spathula TaxID=7913 RepID=UPI001B7E60E0|nr:uracil nucleotide/cysteinyl leukotriene receptor [Polyodon spathula]